MAEAAGRSARPLTARGALAAEHVHKRALDAGSPVRWVVPIIPLQNTREWW